MCVLCHLFFFFHDTATTEIYTYCHTLSLHDALPISISQATRLAARAEREISRVSAALMPSSLRPGRAAQSHPRCRESRRLVKSTGTGPAEGLRSRLICAGNTQNTAIARTPAKIGRAHV